MQGGPQNGRSGGRHPDPLVLEREKVPRQASVPAREETIRSWRRFWAGSNKPSATPSSPENRGSKEDRSSDSRSTPAVRRKGLSSNPPLAQNYWTKRRSRQFAARHHSRSTRNHLRSGSVLNYKAMVLKIDDLSLLATTPVDVSLRKLEEGLNERGWSLGYEPIRRRGGGHRGPPLLGKILNKRIPNLYALRHGEIDDICISVKVKRNGKMVVTKNVPRSATGPDFKKIFIGSNGRYGKIIEATLRIVPLPQKREKIEIVWKNSPRKKAFLKQFWSSGIRPLIFKNRNARGVTIILEGDEEMVGEEKGCLERIARETRGKLTHA